MFELVCINSHIFSHGYLGASVHLSCQSRAASCIGHSRLHAGIQHFYGTVKPLYFNNYLKYDELARALRIARSGRLPSPATTALNQGPNKGYTFVS